MRQPLQRRVSTLCTPRVSVIGWASNPHIDNDYLAILKSTSWDRQRVCCPHFSNTAGTVQWARFDSVGEAYRTRAGDTSSRVSAHPKLPPHVRRILKNSTLTSFANLSGRWYQPAWNVRVGVGSKLINPNQRAGGALSALQRPHKLQPEVNLAQIKRPVDDARPPSIQDEAGQATANADVRDD